MGSVGEAGYHEDCWAGLPRLLKGTVSEVSYLTESEGRTRRVRLVFSTGLTLDVLSAEDGALNVAVYDD